MTCRSTQTGGSLCDFVHGSTALEQEVAICQQATPCSEVVLSCFAEAAAVKSLKLVPEKFYQIFHKEIILP